MTRLSILVLLCGVSTAFGAILQTTTLPTTTVLTEGKWNTSPMVNWFAEFIQGRSIGALKCSSDRCCGDGLKCDMFMHVCVPMDTPVFRDTERPCTNDLGCSPFHTCYLGSCRFYGPFSCRTSVDCFLGFNTTIYECMDLKWVEKWQIAKDLGRINTKMFEHMKPHKLDNDLDVDYDDLEAMGLTNLGDHVMHGKRCWQRCNADNDCMGMFHRVPENVWKNNWGCCNGFCTRRKSCITIPENFRGIEKFENRMPKTMF